MVILKKEFQTYLLANTTSRIEKALEINENQVTVTAPPKSVRSTSSTSIALASCVPSPDCQLRKGWVCTVLTPSAQSIGATQQIHTFNPNDCVFLQHRMLLLVQQPQQLPNTGCLANSRGVGAPHTHIMESSELPSEAGITVPKSGTQSSSLEQWQGQDCS